MVRDKSIPANGDPLIRIQGLQLVMLFKLLLRGLPACSQ